MTIKNFRDLEVWNLDNKFVTGMLRNLIKKL